MTGIDDGPETVVALSYTPPVPGGADAELRLELSGDIDLGNTPLLRQTVSRITSVPPCAVTISLSDVTFIGSTGLKFLADIHRHAARCGIPVVLADPAPIVRRALDICGFGRVFTITAAPARTNAAG